MRKKLGVTLFMVAIFFITSFFVSGSTCHAQDESVASGTSGASGSDSIKIWFGSNKEENAVMEQIAENFTEETGIKVEVVARRSAFDASSDLAKYAELEGSPDIVYMQATDIGNLVESGYLEPLDITDDIKNRYVDVAISAFALEGECYGAGYNNSTSGLIYNKDLISEDELPKTWDEFFELAKSLTIKDENGEYLQRGMLLNVRNMWFVYPIMKEYGGYYYGQDSDGNYNPCDVGLDNEGMLDYVDKMKKLKDEGLVLASRVASESNIVSEFGEGKVAMILYGLWSADYFKKMGIDYGIAELPAHSDGSSSQPLTTVEGFVINSYSDHIDEAKQFLNYILEDENQQALIEVGNGYEQKTGERNPTNISVINSDYVQSDEILSSISEIGEDNEPFPNIAEGTIWYNYTTTSFGTIFYGDSNGNEVDAKEKLTELAVAIREDVSLMNYSAERMDIEWWVYVLAGLFIAVCILAVVFRKRYKNKRNPLYVLYEYKKRVTLIKLVSDASAHHTPCTVLCLPDYS